MVTTSKKGAEGRRIPKRLRLYVEVTDAEWSQLSTEAYVDGTTPAGLVRKLVRRYLSKVTTEKVSG